MLTLRRAVIARSALQQAVWWIGVGAGGVGLAFAIAGTWRAAIACFVGSGTFLWLGGSWALPRSRDSYVVRFNAAWTDWQAATQRNRTALQRGRAYASVAHEDEAAGDRALRVLIRARPRADVADAHADLVDALRAYLDCARELRTA